jgi:hypothetical protein
MDDSINKSKVEINITSIITLAMEIVRFEIVAVINKNKLFEKYVKYGYNPV